MRITYLGHSGLLVEGEKAKIVIDPFLTGNPLAACRVQDLKVDAVALTHGHGDHSCDAAAIAKANDCPVIAVVELAELIAAEGVRTIGMNTGGTLRLDGFELRMTPAFHSSSYVVDGVARYAGQPAGYVVAMDGKTLYHAGDTALFSDMRIIGDRQRIDAAALPIGDHFTMGPEDALLAAQWVGAKIVVPIHYNTFPPIRQDGEAFVRRLEPLGIRGLALKPGEAADI